MIPQPIRFPLDLKGMGTGWAIRNLLEYGNSVLPNDLFEELDVKTVERLISTIINEEIEIYRTSGGYIAERTKRWR